MATLLKSFSLINFSQKSQFCAVLMYSLYGHSRYFKFKQKYQQSARVSRQGFTFLLMRIKSKLNEIVLEIKTKVFFLNSLFFKFKVTWNIMPSTFLLCILFGDCWWPVIRYLRSFYCNRCFNDIIISVSKNLLVFTADYQVDS